jgi:hypothetical protein
MSIIILVSLIPNLLIFTVIFELFYSTKLSKFKNLLRISVLKLNNNLNLITII